mmetsp:Transcript_66354/g.173964  ORF Transcript_66354/g.173964 Transcript_66354/m.173964 type:complete len:202 (+) Transcript_66354:685-1290(+)
MATGDVLGGLFLQPQQVFQRLPELGEVHDAGAVVVVDVVDLLHLAQVADADAELVRELRERLRGGDPGGRGLEVGPLLLHGPPLEERIHVHLPQHYACARVALRRQPGLVYAVLVEVPMRRQALHHGAEARHGDAAAALGGLLLEALQDPARLLDLDLVFAAELARHGLTQDLRGELGRAVAVQVLLAPGLGARRAPRLVA